MPLILDELNYAKQVIENHTEYPKVKHIIILAKYYAHLGNKPSKIKEYLLDYCHQRDIHFNEVLQGWKIKLALREAKKYKIRIPFPVPITKGEIESIQNAPKRFAQEFLFILLVMSKFLKYSNTRIKPSNKPRQIGLFYVNENARYIFRAIDPQIKKKERENIIHELYLLGYIDKTSRDAFIIKYAFENSDVVFMVEDLENIVLYWRRLSGRPIAGCECGRLFVSTRGIKKCPICRRRNKKAKSTLKHI